ncbi:MAG: radical SAM protein [Magnetococcales bacterium]|nr:radical SAM protein [Magnetococcales bacterium]
MNVSLVSFFGPNSFPVRILEASLVAAGFPCTTVYAGGARYVSRMAIDQFDFTQMAKIVLETDPGLVAISVRSIFFPWCQRLAQAIKLQRNVPIIVGGTHAIVAPEACLEIADMVCLGEGEETLVQVAQAVREGRSPDAIDNLWIKKMGGQTIRNPLGKLIQELDLLPIPIVGSRENARKVYLHAGQLQREDPLLVEKSGFYDFMGGRGCPFKCSYCTNSFFHAHYQGKGKMIRYRSVEHVMRELLEVKKVLPDVRLIGANDEVFGMRPDWLNEFCEQYREKIDIPFHCDLHPSFVNERVVSALQTLPMESITIGIQNIDEQIRKDIYQRNIPDSRLKKAIDLLDATDIRIHYDFIFDDPLIGAEQGYQSTIEWMLQRRRPFYIAMYSMQFFPKTTYTDNLVEKGIITRDQVQGQTIVDSGEFRVQGRAKYRTSDHASEYHLKLIDLFNGEFIMTRRGRSYVNLTPNWLIRAFRLLGNHRFMIKPGFFLLRQWTRVIRLVYLSLKVYHRMGRYAWDHVGSRWQFSPKSV